MFLSLRFHPDYGDTTDDIAYNSSFHEKLGRVRYKNYLTMTEAILDSSKEKVSRELSLELRQPYRWLRKLNTFYKGYNFQQPPHLFKLIASRNMSYVKKDTDCHYTFHNWNIILLIE